MNIDWQQIEKEYPSAYSKFIDFLRYENCIMYCDKTIRYQDVQIDFVFIYSLLETFFDQNGIIILPKFIDGSSLWYFVLYPDHKYRWKPINSIEAFGNRYTSRQEAKEAAIYKAFEILNNKLKDR